jgi:hypothetical protein
MIELGAVILVFERSSAAIITSGSPSLGFWGL